MDSVLLTLKLKLFLSCWDRTQYVKDRLANTVIGIIQGANQGSVGTMRYRKNRFARANQATLVAYQRAAQTGTVTSEQVATSTQGIAPFQTDLLVLLGFSVRAIALLQS